MNRTDFNLITKDLPLNSVKRACYIVREYIRCKVDNNLDCCAVTKQEYNAALNILLAYSFTTSENDTTVEQWTCDSDCNKNNGLCGFCDGEFQINSKTGKQLCKYYSNPLDI